MGTSPGTVFISSDESGDGDIDGVTADVGVTTLMVVTAEGVGVGGADVVGVATFTLAVADGIAVGVLVGILTVAADVVGVGVGAEVLTAAEGVGDGLWVASAVDISETIFPGYPLEVS